MNTAAKIGPDPPETDTEPRAEERECDVLEEDVLQLHHDAEGLPRIARKLSLKVGRR